MSERKGPTYREPPTWKTKELYEENFKKCYQNEFKCRESHFKLENRERELRAKNAQLINENDALREQVEKLKSASGRPPSPDYGALYREREEKTERPAGGLSVNTAASLQSGYWQPPTSPGGEGFYIPRSPTSTPPPLSPPPLPRSPQARKSAKRPRTVSFASDTNTSSDSYDEGTYGFY